jgi:hypothetical protein
MQVLVSGSTPTTRVRPTYHAPMPPFSPPADGHEHRVGVRDLFGQLGADRALPGDHLGLVVHVHDEGAGLLGRPRLASSASS